MDQQQHIAMRIVVTTPSQAQHSMTDTTAADDIKRIATTPEYVRWKAYKVDKTA